MTDQFRRFAQMVDTYLPSCSCWFISIKPSPGRTAHLSEMKLANDQIEAEIAMRDRWRFIDWFPLMLDESGRPNEQLFTDDLVHVNGEGYAVLAGLVREALADG